MGWQVWPGGVPPRVQQASVYPEGGQVWRASFLRTLPRPRTGAFQ
jgi:hypothetical protein